MKYTASKQALYFIISEDCGLSVSHIRSIFSKRSTLLNQKSRAFGRLAQAFWSKATLRSVSIGSSPVIPGLNTAKHDLYVFTSKGYSYGGGSRDQQQCSTIRNKLDT